MNHKFTDHIVGIIGIAYPIGSPQKHLEKNIGDSLAQFSQPFIGRLPQKAHAGIEGRTAPHFQTEQTGQTTGDKVGHGEHVVGAHTSGKERLMGVP